MQSIEIAGEELHLLSERAIFWPRKATLLVADLHWGKSTAFRAASLPVPETDLTDLARLEVLVRRLSAKRVILLGDLFHARQGQSETILDAIRVWRSQLADCEFALIRGNHDRSSGDPPADLGIDCFEEPWLDPPFAFRHFPKPTKDAYTFAGHLHPAVRLVGAGRQRLRLPCFHLQEQIGVLPAFGSFTGCSVVRPRATDRVFVVAEGDVIEARV